MFALAVVIAIIWVIFKLGAARLLPGAMGPRDGRIVRIIERVLVDQKNSLLVIDVGPDRMLLGVTEGGINVLTKLGASQPPSDTTRGGPAGFRAVLDAISPKKPSEDDNGGS
jgi:flagellar biogenesis protein FliO